MNIIPKDAPEFIAGVLCKDGEEAKEAIIHVKGILDELELTLHPEKTKIKNFSEGVDFLGFTVYIGHKVPRKKSYLSNTRIRNDFLENLGLKSLSTLLNPEW